MNFYPLYYRQVPHTILRQVLQSKTSLSVSFPGKDVSMMSVSNPFEGTIREVVLL